MLLDDAPADADGAHHDSTAARSRGSRAGAGRATHARAHGVVRVDGDTALGDRVVDNMAFTI